MNDALKQVFISTKRSPEHDFIFSSPRSKPYKDIRAGFAVACKAAGIKDFRIHDMRHTFASWAVMSGCNLRTLQELLGHATYQMTLRYAHLGQSHKQAAVDALGKKISTNLAQSGKIEEKAKTDNACMALQ